MKAIRYSLLSEGSSDQALLPIITWVLRQYCTDIPIQSQWADLRRYANRGAASGLASRIKLSLELYPCDLLFVHRDADRVPHSTRSTEIRMAIHEVAQSFVVPSTVCVVPVKMQEAWLMFDEAAIRRAAGNPNGKHPLLLPRLKEIEAIPDPKRALYDLLRQASGMSGRRLKQFQPNIAVLRVADIIEDFAPLRELSAFRAFEADVEQVVTERGWLSR